MSQTLKKSLFFLEEKNKLKKTTPSLRCNVLDLPLHFLLSPLWVWKTPQLPGTPQEMAQHPQRGPLASASSSTGTLSGPHTTPDHRPVPTSPPPQEEPGDPHHSWRKKKPQGSRSFHPLAKQSTQETEEADGQLQQAQQQ